MNMLPLAGLVLTLIARPAFCADALTSGTEQAANAVEVAQKAAAEHTLTVALFGTKDPYTRLESFYNAAKNAAAPLDFAFNANDATQTCEYVSKGSTSFIQTYIRRVSSVMPGEPSHGPLFPGADADKMEKVIFWNGSPLTPYHVRAVENKQDGNDLIIVIKKSNAWVDSPIAIRIKKNQNLIAYHGVTHADSEEKRLEFYGYCYSKP